VLRTLKGIQGQFDGAQTGGKKISLADPIVLAGAAAIEKAAKDSGQSITCRAAPET
jgi:catalase-peroxidase